MTTVQKSRTVYGTARFPAVTVWMDGQGVIWLTQNDQDVTYEAWEASGLDEDTDIFTNGQMLQEIHEIADKWIDAESMN